MAAIIVVSRHVADGIALAVTNPFRWTYVERTRNWLAISLVTNFIAVSIRVVLDGHVRTCRRHLQTIAVVEVVELVVAQIIAFAVSKPTYGRDFQFWCRRKRANLAPSRKQDSS